MATKTVPKLSTIERLLDEVEEYSEHVRKVRSRLRRVKPGSEAYHDLLPDITVYLEWLKMKAEHAAEALDGYQESLPDDE